MATFFIVEDLRHAEAVGSFETRSEAIDEARRLASVPWDAEPNLAPCTQWRTCGREWEVVEISNGQVISRFPVVTVTAKVVHWAPGFDPTGPAEQP